MKHRTLNINHMLPLILVLISCHYGILVAQADPCDESYILSGTSPSSVLPLSVINSLLKEHNEARRFVRPFATVMPMLRWNQRLADFAQEYMDACNGMVHSPLAVRQNISRFGFAYVGENLAAGNLLGKDQGGPESVKLWNSESAQWIFPQSCGAEATCGHYTQVIWAATTDMGCGYAYCPNLSMEYFWSCVYGPGGNWVGENPYSPTDEMGNASVCTLNRTSFVTSTVVEGPGVTTTMRSVSLTTTNTTASSLITTSSVPSVQTSESNAMLNNVSTAANTTILPLKPFVPDLPLTNTSDDSTSSSSDLHTTPGYAYNTTSLNTEGILNFNGSDTDVAPSQTQLTVQYETTSVIPSATMTTATSEPPTQMVIEVRLLPNYTRTQVIDIINITFHVNVSLTTHRCVSHSEDICGFMHFGPSAVFVGRILLSSNATELTLFGLASAAAVDSYQRITNRAPEESDNSFARKVLTLIFGTLGGVVVIGGLVSAIILWTQRPPERRAAPLESFPTDYNALEMGGFVVAGYIPLTEDDNSL